MVLLLGVLVEESADNAWSHALVDGEFCNYDEDIDPYYHTEKRDTCEALRKADKWYYVMLFTANIGFILSLVCLLAFFAEWILFVALVSNMNKKHLYMIQHANFNLCS